MSRPDQGQGAQMIPESMTNLLPAEGLGEEEGAQCLEKRVYYKVISGEWLLFAVRGCEGRRRGEGEKSDADAMVWTR